MRSRLTVALVLLLAGARVAHALGPLDVLIGEETSRAARLDTGLQTGVVGWLAYDQRLPRLLDRDLAFEVRLGLPVIRPDFGDWGLEGGAQLELWGHGRWHLRNQLDLGLRTVETAVFDGIELLVRDTVSFGWHARAGGFGLDLGWEQGLATHIAHSDWYRNEIYPGAEDGWLAFPAGRVRVGLSGNLALGAHALAGLRLGIDWDRTGRPDYVPLVAVLTGAWRF